jgi:ABC-2 type transport system permease protein
VNGLSVGAAQVSALARRDLRQELSYHFQLFMRVFTIGMSVVMFFFLGRLVGDAAEVSDYQGGYFTFALMGMVVIGLAQVCVMSFARSLQAAQSDGTLEILLSTSTRLPVLLAGTLVVPMLFGVLEASIYLAFARLVAGVTATLAAAATASVLLVLTLGTFAAVGILSGAVIVLTKRGDPFSNLVLQATNLLAGGLFPVAVMPEWMQLLSRAVPAFYGLRGIRDVLLAGAAPSDVLGDIVVLVAFNVVMLPASAWALSRALRLARVTGTLGNR